ncbi:winged helix-turn-helix transcriptional regulator [Kitasatospora sp. NPDC006697]|uniref:winged helix-turn-helix transcriptional regulator n=1 Tax=Kitasatospora sp. NPDC006697 TaxID=3364020 RepID=UPI0036AF3099
MEQPTDSPGLEYCPVTAAVQAVGDRWTLLVLRELLMGSHHFNDIHRGLPGANRTLLSGRLRRMQADGLVHRRPGPDGRPGYHLTPAGAALEPVVWQLGDWARQWHFGEPQREQLDAGWLLWRLRQFVRPERLPDRRVVAEFVLHDQQEPPEHAWLLLAPGDISACHVHPGHDTDLWVTADLRAMHRLVAGTTTLAAAGLDLSGDPALTAAFPGWFAWRVPGTGAGRS